MSAQVRQDQSKPVCSGQDGTHSSCGCCIGSGQSASKHGGGEGLKTTLLTEELWIADGREQETAFLRDVATSRPACPMVGPHQECMASILQLTPHLVGQHAPHPVGPTPSRPPCPMVGPTPSRPTCPMVGPTPVGPHAPWSAPHQEYMGSTQEDTEFSVRGESVRRWSGCDHDKYFILKRNLITCRSENRHPPAPPSPGQAGHKCDPRAAQGLLCSVFGDSISSSVLSQLPKRSSG